MQKHDLIGLQILDPLEQEIPNVGLIALTDSETGHEMIIDSSDSNMNKIISQHHLQNNNRIKSIFSKSNADFLSMDIQNNYIKTLIKFFKSRK